VGHTARLPEIGLLLSSGSPGFRRAIICKLMSFIPRLKTRFAEKRTAWLIRRNTLVGPERIQTLSRLAQRIEDEQIPGDIVECGVYKGGTAAILARLATHSRLPRTVWLFDSFQGMPPTTAIDGPYARKWVGKLTSSPRHVQRLLRRVGADISRVRIVPGLFEDTFPAFQIPQIALLNIDADWYESVKLCFEKFYDAVVPGGFVSIDDYGAWPGCRIAVDEFFQEHALPYQLQRVDYTAHWFQKS
jgi:O-methyltransferase